jgi:hypothetical protein
VKLSEHFTAEEVGYWDTPAELRPNVLATVALLERLRVTWGVPVKVNSVYRSAAENAATAGAASSSQHLDATAADVEPIGLPYATALGKVLNDFALHQRFGQFIHYDAESHFHIALPTRGKVGEILRRTSSEYLPVARGKAPASILAGLSGSTLALVAGLVAAGVLLVTHEHKA